jgi:Ferritin-like domain
VLSREVLSHVLGEATSRRSVLKKLGIAAAAAGVATVTGTGTRILEAQSPLVMTDLLQFTLNLEYLESEFYTMATQGVTIDQLGVPIDGQGSAGPTVGGRAVHFQSLRLFSREIAIELAANERAHVMLFRNTLQQLGVTPVAKPAINLEPTGREFNDEIEFVIAARRFEELGSSLGAGAAANPLINTTPFIATLGRLIGVEAQHAGNLRLQIAELGIPIMPIDGADIVPYPTPGGQAFSVNSNGLTATRTPGQVLYVAYGGQANAKSGGFFPNGVNGVINMSSAPAAVFPA